MATLFSLFSHVDLTIEGKIMSNKNLELAAQCWCDEETSHIVMESPLAEAFAKRLDEKDELIDKLQDIAIWMTGCGYDFSQHEFYTDNQHCLTEGVKSVSDVIDKVLRP